jgi:hypothetical protein
MTFEIDKPHLLESIHDFVGRLPLLRERVCMSVFAEVDKGNSKRLMIRMDILASQSIKRLQ